MLRLVPLDINIKIMAFGFYGSTPPEGIQWKVLAFNELSNVPTVRSSSILSKILTSSWLYYSFVSSYRICVTLSFPLYNEE